VKKKYR